MSHKLVHLSVGPWPMNAYIVIDQTTHTSVIVDPGAEPEAILKHTEGNKVEKILITHGHGDHVMALEDIKDVTKAPIFLHPEDADYFDLNYDVPLQGGQRIAVGNLTLKVIHTPGHTPGQCCFDLGDGRVIVGDTVFVGGPGRTQSPADFATTMKTMQQIVFQWPDRTEFFPGHGPSGRIGDERHTFEAFVARGWPPDLHGDVTWK